MNIGIDVSKLSAETKPLTIVRSDLKPGMYYKLWPTNDNWHEVLASRDSAGNYNTVRHPDKEFTNPVDWGCLPTDVRYPCDAKGNLSYEVKPSTVKLSDLKPGDVFGMKRSKGVFIVTNDVEETPGAKVGSPTMILKDGTYVLPGDVLKSDWGKPNTVQEVDKRNCHDDKGCATYKEGGWDPVVMYLDNGTLKRVTPPQQVCEPKKQIFVVKLHNGARFTLNGSVPVIPIPNAKLVEG